MTTGTVQLSREALVAYNHPTNVRIGEWVRRGACSVQSPRWTVRQFEHSRPRVRTVNCVFILHFHAYKTSFWRFWDICLLLFTNCSCMLHAPFCLQVTTVCLCYTYNILHFIDFKRTRWSSSLRLPVTYSAQLSVARNFHRHRMTVLQRMKSTLSICNAQMRFL